MTKPVGLTLDEAGHMASMRSEFTVDLKSGGDIRTYNWQPTDEIDEIAQHPTGIIAKPAAEARSKVAKRLQLMLTATAEAFIGTELA
jgi:hypothetical protein